VELIDCTRSELSNAAAAVHSRSFGRPSTAASIDASAENKQTNSGSGQGIYSLQPAPKLPIVTPLKRMERQVALVSTLLCRARACLRSLSSWLLHVFQNCKDDGCMGHESWIQINVGIKKGWQGHSPWQGLDLV